MREVELMILKKHIILKKNYFIKPNYYKAEKLYILG